MNNSELAKTLGISVEDLMLCDFFNQEIFDSSGVAVKNEFVFTNKSPEGILKRIKGLDNKNSIILDI